MNKMTDPVEELKGINLEQVIWDELAEELAKQHTEQLLQIIIQPGFHKYFTESQDNSFFGKLRYGWRLFALSFSDWQDALTSEEYVDDFFYYLGYREEL